MFDNLFPGGRMPQLLYADMVDLPVGEPIHVNFHNHEDVTELLWILTGTLDVTIGGKLFTVSEGSFLWYQRGMWHEEHSREELPYKMIYLGFHGLQLDNMPTDYLTDTARPPFMKITAQRMQMEERVKEVMREYLIGLPVSRLKANLLLGLILTDLVILLYEQEIASNDAVKRFPIEKIKTYIHNYYNCPLSLQELSAIANLSPFYFSRTFRRETGLAPIQYVVRYRMEVAKMYLRTTALNVEEIALQVGYQSHTQFQITFKAHTALTPRQYRLSVT